MELEIGDDRYEWIEDWATIPDTESGRENGRTHGIDVTTDGRIVVFNQADPAVLIYDSDGTQLDSWGSTYGGAHGLTIASTAGREILWLTDQNSATVAEATFEGQVLRTLDPPAHPAYEDGEYVPTWVAVDDETGTGSGDIWVADGYGESLVHRYDADGQYRTTIDGTGGAGRFDCPHGISVLRRDSATEPKLYIADRGNERIQVYTPAGRFDRSIDGEKLTSPCTVARDGTRLLVPELYARVTVLDDKDEVVATVGSNEEIVDTDAWPNVPAAELAAGAFNSPHDAVVDQAGNIYVAEWIIGGRLTKLVRR